jgi:hypothetical protein
MSVSVIRDMIRHVLETSQPRRTFRTILVTACIAAAAVFATACREGMDRSSPDVASKLPSPELLAQLAHSRVFFAHQSVGQNIVEGLQGLQSAGAAPLRIVKLEDSKPGATPAFIHARLGTNGDPKGKTDAFVATLENGLGDSVNIALQKYCFVDFEAGTDVHAVFDYYRTSMQRLQQRFPKLTILHVTSPIVVVQSGPRAIVKRWIGRTPDYYPENAVREQFNELMRAEYGRTGRLFDLAAIEASKPGAAAEPILFQGKRLYTLLPEYSTDGGHLNDGAQRRVASALVSFLASASKTAVAQ